MFLLFCCAHYEHTAPIVLVFLNFKLALDMQVLDVSAAGVSFGSRQHAAGNVHEEMLPPVPSTQTSAVDMLLYMGKLSYIIQSGIATVIAPDVLADLQTIDTANRTRVADALFSASMPIHVSVTVLSDHSQGSVRWHLNES